MTIRESLILIAAVVCFAGPAHSSCNTRSGFVANQPAADPADQLDPLPPGAQDQAAPSEGQSGLDGREIQLNLSRDLTSLIGFSGPYTDNVPVLGVRMENLPGYNAKRYCNAVQPILIKPKIERTPDGRIIATAENGRFRTEFDPSKRVVIWLRDCDKSKHFFWIFPGPHPNLGLPHISQRYNTSYLNAAEGSDNRRWIAEAYLDLSMRFNFTQDLDKKFPQGRRPTEMDLDAAIQASTQVQCSDDSSELVCLASRLIEMNETAPPDPTISAAAFVVGDALLEESGVSTGIRQLDFGTDNAQANALVKPLLPRTVGRYRHGYGYRRPIRAWNVDVLNRWFDQDGPRANAELSLDSAKRLLLQSQADYLKTAASDWSAATQSSYPTWDVSSRTSLALIAIDLENVSGYRLHFSATATNLCAVLTDTTITGQNKRSNASVARDEHQRIKNAKSMLGKLPDFVAVDWSCLASLES